MMTTFTDWDILRNLLLAARWTVVLSLIAFIGGATAALGYPVSAWLGISFRSVSYSRIQKMSGRPPCQPITMRPPADTRRKLS